MDGAHPSPDDVPQNAEAPFWEGKTEEAPLAAQPTESAHPEELHPGAEIASGTARLDHKLFLCISLKLTSWSDFLPRFSSSSCWATACRA
jgi:hypothetical protein